MLVLHALSAHTSPGTQGSKHRSPDREATPDELVSAGGDRGPPVLSRPCCTEAERCKENNSVHKHNLSPEDSTPLSVPNAPTCAPRIYPQ